MAPEISDRIAHELERKSEHVAAALELFGEGATIPFVARYRKERTGGMDEEVLRVVRDRSEELQALDKRRAAILSSLAERELLTDELKAAVEQAPTLAELEDVYLPYRPKRKTRASTAVARGLQPLARAILDDGNCEPEVAAEAFVDPDKEVPDTAAAVAGASDIIAEWISEDKTVRGTLRELFRRRSSFRSRKARGADEGAETYADYFDWTEPVQRAAPHRIHAVLRGAREGALTVHAGPEEEHALDIMWRAFVIHGGLSGPGQARRKLLEDIVADAYKRLLYPSLENEVLRSAKETADRTAAAVFASNLRDLLMEPPLGRKPVLAVDPGFRTGCKVVCLNEQGDLLHHETIYPLEPKKKTRESTERLRALAEQFRPDVVAVGNGTGGREAEEFLKETFPESAGSGNPSVVMVDEAGASVYSASDAARREFPDQDVTVRGAVSIGRRLMDPLAELVKIDPAAIGVGQYQHDVDSTLMKRTLDDTVTSCVNAVGVDLNTSGIELLQYVSGLSQANADAIVAYRKENGPFETRSRITDVPGIGPKTAEQAMGFLRVYEGPNPLDGSAVHPERYELVQQMAEDLGTELTDLIGDAERCKSIPLERYVSGDVGMPTLKDIIDELVRPGRDPRPAFETFAFSDAVHTLEDLKPGQVLPGRVTNVTNFGAFVDIGVHRDGLVHISKLADRFVKDPRTVVRVHQTVTVEVLEVDTKRKRINLKLVSRE